MYIPPLLLPLFGKRPYPFQRYINYSFWPRQQCCPEGWFKPNVWQRHKIASFNLKSSGDFPLIKVSSFQLALISHPFPLKVSKLSETRWQTAQIRSCQIQYCPNRVFLMLSPGGLTTRIEFEIFNSAPVLKTAVKSDEWNTLHFFGIVFAPPTPPRLQKGKITSAEKEKTSEV